MKASTCTTCITCLPREILVKIASGLPVKSAVRFRCSCKLFYCYIEEPRFAFRILFLLRSKTCGALSLNSVSYSEERHGRVEADSAQVLDVGGGLSLSCQTISSSFADGEMCLLSDILRRDALFDIRTGRRISLPSIIDNDCVLRTRLFSYGVLGFDSVSERHKVFKSAVYTDLGRVWYRQWVLTVEVDKSWREIESTSFSRYDDAAVHIHGIIYFIPRLMLSSSKIGAMDVATERFISLIPFPPSQYQFSQWLRDRERRWVPWINFNGRLAFINIIIPIPARDEDDPTPADSKIEIWRLERSMEEWEKQMLLLPLEESEVIGQATFMGCTTNSVGEIVFLLQSNLTSRLILIYSFESEIWRRFEIPKPCNNNSFYLSDMKGVVHAENEM